ncbi:MAG: SpoIID/LytB domain-containing protein [Deltaproteobacteria bacterium]|nr:SpoIID/LytB domain-containing protein [Deltaproteobacteria bacterium]
MRRTFPAIILVVFFCVAPLCVSSGYAYNIQHEMKAADTYLKRGMYLEAIGAYRDVADHSADYNMRAKAVLRIGDIYSYFLNNYDGALHHYTFVKTYYGSSIHAANAYFNSGMILYEKNRYQDAIVQFREYLRQFPAGKRRQTAQFMIETCMKPPPAVKKKKEAVKEIHPDEIIRVLIHEGMRQFNIAASASFEIKDPRERNTIMRLPGRRTFVVDAQGDDIRLDGRTLGRDGIAVLPLGNGMLTINGSPYRGKIILKRASGGIDIINVVRLEEYLYGVVPKEMSPQWPSEALKSQAVAARTYALYQKEKNRDKDHDVYASTSSQVYGGFGVEEETTTRAVNDTTGKVLCYGSNLILAYFHANSGGVTEDAKNVWTADVPYLKSVRDDFSAQAPNTQWNKYVDLVSVGRSLRAKGVDVGTIFEIVPAEISPSGRVRNIRIRHSRGETTLSGNHFRIKVDPKLIKSTLFTIRRSGNGVGFYGKGYGHGVGMSQWGACQMAKSGHPYTNILRYYYSGVEIR